MSLVKRKYRVKYDLWPNGCLQSFNCWHMPAEEYASTSKENNSCQEHLYHCLFLTLVSPPMYSPAPLSQQPMPFGIPSASVLLPQPALIKSHWFKS